MKHKHTVSVAAAEALSITLIAAGGGWEVLSPAGKKIESDD